MLLWLYAVNLTFHFVTVTFDVLTWTFATYRLWHNDTLYQIWTQASNPRRSYCLVWPYDLEHGVTCCARYGIRFTKFDLRQLIRAWIIACADTLCYGVTLIFDPLTLKVRITSGVTWSQSVQNVSEIEQSAAELLIILRIFVHVVTLTFDLLILNFYSTSGVMRLNSV